MNIFKNIFGILKNQSTPKVYSPDFETMTDFSQVPSIFRWTLHSDATIAKDCAETVHRLLNSKTSFKNKTLYIPLKDIYLKTKDLDKFSNFETDIRNSLFCIASMNENGYVREKALKILVTMPTQKTFPFILFRLADWVPLIRQIAKDSISELTQHQEPKFLIHHHKIISWLLKVERTNLQKSHEEIITFIFSDKNIEEVLQNIEDYDEGDRYFIFRNIIERSQLNDQILEKLLHDKNYLIRLLAARNIDLINRPEILKRLVRDRNQKIRYYAVNQIPENQLAQFEIVLNELLFDESIGIRTTSRYLLSKIRNQRFVDVYRKEIKRNPTVGSILGLSEVGDRSDLDVLRSFLDVVSPKQRAAGLYAVSNLDYNKAKELAFKSLKDVSNTVKKTCVILIPREKASEDLKKLRRIYDLGDNVSKRFVLKIISKYGGWDIVGDFLKGINNEDKKINQIAYALLKGWNNYSIRLGVEQKKTDRDYVMGIYKELNIENCKIPYDIKKIIAQIPFVFKQNEK